MSKKDTPIVVGTRLYTDSQNRGNGIVYAVYNVNEKLPSVQHAYRSAKTYDIVFHDGTKALDVEEHTLTSHCWAFVEGIAPIEEIESLLANSASEKAARLRSLSIVLGESPFESN